MPLPPRVLPNISRSNRGHTAVVVPYEASLGPTARDVATARRLPIINVSENLRRGACTHRFKDFMYPNLYFNPHASLWPEAPGLFLVSRALVGLSREVELMGLHWAVLTLLHDRETLDKQPFSLERDFVAGTAEHVDDDVPMDDSSTSESEASSEGEDVNVNDLEVTEQPLIDDELGDEMEEYGYTGLDESLDGAEGGEISDEDALDNGLE